MPNGYIKPRSSVKHTKTERAKLILDNFQHYRTVALKDQKLLSERIPAMPSRMCWTEWVRF
jgi:hypothetical protein